LFRLFRLFRLFQLFRLFRRIKGVSWQGRGVTPEDLQGKG
jgi:hypothetical protein